MPHVEGHVPAAASAGSNDWAVGSRFPDHARPRRAHDDTKRHTAEPRRLLAASKRFCSST